jgi:type I restriction enzyme S subunit
MLEVFRYFQQSGRFARIALKTTSIAHLGTARFAKLAVPIPPFQVQQSISNLLNQFGQVIQTQSQLLARKKQSKQAIAQKLFAGSSSSTALDERIVRLRDVTRELRKANGQRPASPVMGVSKFDGIVPMRERTIGTDLTRYKVLRPRAFAYNPMRVNIGSIARWMGEEDVLVSPDYVVFEAIDGKLDDRFLDHYRRSSAWQRYIEAAGKGSVRVRIYYDDLAAMPLGLPSIEEQRRIADVLDLLDREISLLQRQCDLLDKQKRAIAHKLLAGEVLLKAHT